VQNEIQLQSGVLDVQTGSSTPPERVFAVTTSVAFVPADAIGLGSSSSA